ncbi:2-amino-3-ketobutyrate coenzyme A ligase, mitochondrial [Harpegnathos saltator]|uniref:2-amino-3-ketobutyrate coenzyme A ligase, mitochondrial n=1 Tax=Harpegnathos saltator TaxID=610380 RepID=E2BV32_HARSA|nr:2-amino-3-ketobutyrate coenzyme A ligase, mitochondrial [Harpegnathos saltator]
MADLEYKLQESKSAHLRLIVSDGVFSMDGTIAPLPDIIELAEKYDAITFIDDCHATGIFGKTGRGTEEYYNRLGSIDIINSTLGKALGGAAGGYTTTKKDIVSLLRQRSRPYLFSNSLPPPVVASASKVMDLIMDNATYLNRLADNTKYFRNALTKAGFIISGDNHPICPVILGDAKLATKFADKMIGMYMQTSI